MRVLWDSKKNQIIKKKHGFYFEDAVGIFDNISMSFGGDLISEDPDQYVVIGFSKQGNLLTVVYEFREDDRGEFIWLVTLWKTTLSERKRFKL